MKQTEKRELKAGLTEFMREKLVEPSKELEVFFGVEEIARVKEGVGIKMVKDGETVFATVRVTVKKASFDFEGEKAEVEAERVEKLKAEAEKLAELEKEAEKLKGE